MTEIWFTPTDETTIESIFESMKHCQSLHPDANGMAFSVFFLPNTLFIIDELFFLENLQIVSQMKKMNS